MDSAEFSLFATAHNFAEVGHFAMRGDRLVFERSGLPFDKCKLVYVWVATGNGHAEVLYAGKAGGDIYKRMREHGNGFLSQGAGEKNRDAVRGALACGQCVLVLARCSEEIECFGHRVSLCATEEKALIEMLKPTLNDVRRRKTKNVRTAQPLLVNYRR